MLDRATAELLAVHLRDRAELAAQRTASDGLYDVAYRALPVIAEKLLARHRHIFKVYQFVGAVNLLEIAGHEIGHEFVPDRFGFVDHHGVEMFGAFLGQKSRVAAAAYYPNAPFAEVVGQIIAALGLAGHHSDPDHVG